MDSVKKQLNESAAMRWSVLVLVSGLTFGTYWFQDCLGPLKPLMLSQLGLSNSQFGLLVSATTWANLALMIILGGMALDRWGIRKTGTLFGLLATVGASLVALGSMGTFGQDKNTMLTTMVIGRILFGTGLETVCVLISRVIIKWFRGYELALAMALNIGFGRLGAAGTNLFGIEIASDSIARGLSFAASLIGLGLILFIVYLILDVKFDRRMQTDSADAAIAKSDEFKFRDLVALISDRSFIFIALLCVSFYSAVFPFIQYAPDLLVNKFGFSLKMPDTDGMSFWQQVYAFLHNGPKVTSLIPFGTILFTPIFGRLVDKKGKAASIMMLGSFLLIFAHLSLSIFNSVALAYVGLLCLGVAFSLVPAAMWPSLAKIVAESRLGTAYGTMFTIQNYGLALFYWGIGKVLDLTNPGVVQKIEELRRQHQNMGFAPDQIAQKIDQDVALGVIPPWDYTIPILMLVLLGVISIFLAYQLKQADKEQGYGLELPSGVNK